MGANIQELVRINSEPIHTPVPAQLMPRTSSEVVLQQPKPVPAGRYTGSDHSRVQWKLGSEG